MKVIVTGATGFIGKHLLKKMSYRKDIFEEIVTMSRRPIIGNLGGPNAIKHYACDLSQTDATACDYACMRRICEKHKPDIIFHLAANPITKLDNNRPSQIIVDNVAATQNVVHYAPEGCRVVLASSVVVYGDWLYKQESTGRYNEEHQAKPTSIYGITKLASEQIVSCYSDMDRINGVSLRLCATVGQGLTHGVIKDFILKLRYYDKLKVLGDHPGSTKPYAHIDDVTNVLIKMSLNDEKGEYNLVPDDELNIEELAETVMRACGTKKEIEWLGEAANWKGDNRIIRVSNAKLKDWGWSPKYPTSKAAIFETVRHYV